MKIFLAIVLSIMIPSYLNAFMTESYYASELFNETESAYVEQFYKASDNDDTEAIQRAFDSGIPKILFKNKEYFISRPLIMNRYHILEGVGRDSGGGTRIVAKKGFSALASASIPLARYGIRTPKAMVIIRNNSIEMSHLCFEGGKNAESLYADYGLVAIPENSNPSQTLYGLRLCDIGVSFCKETGVDLSVFMCTLDRVTVRYCGIGFSIHGIEYTDNKKGTFYVPGTTMLLSQCYARSCYMAGYDIANMNYSLLQCCAADDCGLTNALMNLRDRTMTNGYGYAYAYRLYVCNNLSISSCGSEGCFYNMFIALCQHIRVETFREYNPNLTAWTMEGNSTSIVQSQYVTFDNCHFEGEAHFHKGNEELKKKIMAIYPHSSSVVLRQCSITKRGRRSVIDNLTKDNIETYDIDILRIDP